MTASTLPHRQPQFRIALPRTWVELPLDRRRRVAISRLLRRRLHQPPGREGAALRDALRTRLDQLTSQAAAEGVTAMYACVEPVDGVPLPASLTCMPLPSPPGGIEALWAALLEDDPAARRWRSGGRDVLWRSTPGDESEPSVAQVFIHGGVPDFLLLLTFSTPVPELAEAYLALFEAMVRASRWG